MFLVHCTEISKNCGNIRHIYPFADLFLLLEILNCGAPFSKECLVYLEHTYLIYSMFFDSYVMDELVLGKYSKTMVIAAHHLVNTKILIVKVKTILT